MALKTGSATEALVQGDVVLWEQEHAFCRSVVTLITSATVYVVGSVLGKITASSKFVHHDAGAVDGSEDAVAVCLVNVDASTGDVTELIMDKGPSIVKSGNLTWKSGISAGDKTAGEAALLALGIEVRV